jgi:hypothetical protein
MPTPSTPAQGPSRTAAAGHLLGFIPPIQTTLLWKRVLLVAGIVATKGPSIVDRIAVLIKGEPIAPEFLHWASLVIGIATILVSLQLNPVPTPSPTDGAASSGAGSSPPVNPSPKPSSSARLGFALSPLVLFVLGALLVGSAAPLFGPRPTPAPAWSAEVRTTLQGAPVAIGGCNNPNALNTATTLLTPPAECLTAAIVSGQIDFANPATAALQLVAACAGVTVATVVTFLEGLLAPSDAGADAGIGAAPSSILAQLPSVLVELRKLPPTWTQVDAKKALGLAR